MQTQLVVFESVYRSKHIGICQALGGIALPLGLQKTLHPVDIFLVTMLCNEPLTCQGSDGVLIEYSAAPGEHGLNVERVSTLENFEHLEIGKSIAVVDVELRGMSGN